MLNLADILSVPDPPWQWSQGGSGAAIQLSHKMGMMPPGPRSVSRLWGRARDRWKFLPAGFDSARKTPDALDATELLVGLHLVHLLLAQQDGILDVARHVAGRHDDHLYHLDKSVPLFHIPASSASEVVSVLMRVRIPAHEVLSADVHLGIGDEMEHGTRRLRGHEGHLDMQGDSQVDVPIDRVLAFAVLVRLPVVEGVSVIALDVAGNTLLALALLPRSWLELHNRLVRRQRRRHVPNTRICPHAVQDSANHADRKLGTLSDSHLAVDQELELACVRLEELVRRFDEVVVLANVSVGVLDVGTHESTD